MSNLTNVSRQNGHVIKSCRRISYTKKYKKLLLYSQWNFESTFYTFKHEKQTVWEHCRNFGFLSTSSYSHKQTPQVTRSSTSLDVAISLQSTVLLSSIGQIFMHKHYKMKFFLSVGCKGLCQNLWNFPRAR